MELKYNNEETFIDFVKSNEAFFLEQLIEGLERNSESFNTSKILEKGDLLQAGMLIVEHLSFKSTKVLKQMAIGRGRLLAEKEIPLFYALDFFKVCRKVFWQLLNYYSTVSKDIENWNDNMIEVNFLFDDVISDYVKAYNDRKNEIFEAQETTINELTTPVISLTDSMAILPILGTIDTHRAKQIQQRTLQVVGDNRIKRLVIDLSGITYMDTFVLKHLFNIIEGLKILGCSACLSGIKADVANAMIGLGITIDEFDVKSNLQEALESYIVKQ